ncbi:hypothetical protein NM208_g6417 [Fusarium decemcellulare]|uniref:Uncharacterized protein n=1 Tax=Fusarium decemcellulare TaxID=57161 RepID=A0ACC1SDD2_9HYPO|nr:hypothetical protein NM208_g6417 [Fusarium decemcellulare]
MSDPKTYTVGWICAIKAEFVAAQAFFDEEHADLELVDEHDNNTYALGRIGKHNVVVAVLPKSEYGTTSAATVARDMLRTFGNIRFGLMVGIGGGAPSAEHDIRLGDVVVSSRDKGKGAVFQYDYGKATQDHDFEPTGFLSPPPQLLLTAMHGLEAKYDLEGHQLMAHVERALEQRPRLRKLRYSRPASDTDRLYRTDVVHPDPLKECGAICSNDATYLVARKERDEDENDPAVHFGLIASANQVMKDATARDKMAASKGVLCFEMEAAGLMNHFPCVVIRGICDYSDSHKNKDWQGFAAMTAAAFAKDLLGRISPTKVEAERPISEALVSIQSSIDKTMDLVSTIQLDQHATKVKKWLKPADYSTNAVKAMELRYEGTGAWILDDPVFQEWKTGSRRHLWLHGLSGCGKTVLITTILESLRRSSNHKPLAFFFDFRDERKQTLDGLFCSLAFQLYTTGGDVAKKLDELYDDCNYGQEKPGPNALPKFLDFVARETEGMVVVIDALDECNTQEELVKWIRGFACTKAKLIVTSRPEETFNVSLPEVFDKRNCVPLNTKAVDGDIHTYVSGRLQQDVNFTRRKLSEDLLEEIRDNIGNGSDGMFRLAALQMDHLATQCLHANAIRRALKSLPQTLGQFYDRMVENIPQDLKYNAVRLLQFLVHAKRPLALSEAIQVLATEMDQDPPRFDKGSELDMKTDVLRYCPGFVFIAEVMVDDKAVEELHIAHFSVKEFFLTKPDFIHPAPDIMITKTCLTYLRDIKGSDPQTKVDFPMASYAAEHWIEYAQLAEASDDVVEQIVGFVTNETTFQRWVLLRVADHNLEAKSGRPYNTSILYQVCLGGLTKTAKVLIKDGADVNVRGEEYDCPLQAASAGGHLDTVQLLLDNGADVNAQGGTEGNALQAACAAGHLEVVKLLINHGADVNPENGITITPGGSVRIPNGRFNNPLDAAAANGHLEVVRLLLEKGADVNARSTWNFFSTKAKAAGYIFVDQILPYMLDNGVRIIVAGGYTNKLYAASYEERRDYVKTWISKHMFSILGGDYRTPLAAALGQDHEEVAQLLIEHGARHPLD